MQEAYVNINDIPTHIMTWGKWIEESLDTKEVVICITGNPGLPGFYTRFLHELHASLDHQMPIWLIGHQGHDDPPVTSIRKVPQLEGNERLYDLDGQIKHKIDFIEKYVPPGVKIHLIGHSIGAWMILELLKRPEIKERVQKCYLLFPTIERMAVTSNGFWYTKVFLRFFFILRLLLSAFLMLPTFVQTFLVYIYFLVSSIPETFLGTGLKYATRDVMERVNFLALDEMKRVKALDVDVVKGNVHLLKLYYGTTDGWVPVKYYEEIKARVPNIDAQLDTKKIDHAFVLRSSTEMGNIVAEMIKENRRSN